MLLRELFVVRKYFAQSVNFTDSAGLCTIPGMIKKETKKSIQTKQNKIVIFQDSRGNVELSADVKKETIWATQAQIAELFDIDRTVATRHINNIFKDDEISQKSNVQKMHIPSSDRPISLHSLDIILAVGYRTNSRKAIQFRQWATKTLREYIMKGIAVNTERLKQLPEKMIHDLDEKIRFIQRTIERRELNKSEVYGLLSVIDGYANSFLLLKKYDDGDIVLRKSKSKEKRHFDYDFVRPSVDALAAKLTEKGEASDLFAAERDGTFAGILRTIYQTFDGSPYYQFAIITEP